MVILAINYTASPTLSRSPNVITLFMEARRKATDQSQLMSISLQLCVLVA